MKDKCKILAYQIVPWGERCACCKMERIREAIYFQICLAVPNSSTLSLAEFSIISEMEGGVEVGEYLKLFLKVANAE